MDDRLPAALEAAAIVRRVQAGGGFAAVLRKGDPDRGALVLVLRCRGEFRGILERQMGPDFAYRWTLAAAERTESSGAEEDLIASRQRFDPDLWLIELDVAEPERFIAETTLAG